MPVAQHVRQTAVDDFVTEFAERQEIGVVKCGGGVILDVFDMMNYDGGCLYALHPA
jgi:hypothetical protein